MRAALSSVLLLLVACIAVADAQSSLRITPTASLFDRYEVDEDWARLPEGEEWGGVTTGVAADGKGTVVVLVRTAPYFRIFRTDGAFVTAWGDAETFVQPHSVHFGPDGAVWATDPTAHAVYKFSLDGELLLTLGKKGSVGGNSSTDAFNRPAGLAVSDAGDIFVADGYVNARIVHFDEDGNFVGIIGGRHGSGPGELQLPHSVAIGAANQIVVGDSDNKRVSVFDMDGGFLESFPSPSRGGIAATADGTILVSDVNAGAVTVLRDGAIVDVIRVGNRPHGLGVDPSTGDIYIASTVPDAPAVTKVTLKRGAAR